MTNKITENRRLGTHKSSVSNIEWISRQNFAQKDAIIENMSTTPLGKLLSVVATLPEIRQDKVNRIKELLTNGEYNIEKNLDAALENMLDEFLIEG